MIASRIRVSNRPSRRFSPQPYEPADWTKLPFVHGLAIPPIADSRTRRVSRLQENTSPGDRLPFPAYGEPISRNRVRIQDGPSFRAASSITSPLRPPRLRKFLASRPYRTRAQHVSNGADRARCPRSNDRAQHFGARVVDIFQSPRPPPISGTPQFPR